MKEYEALYKHVGVHKDTWFDAGKQVGHRGSFKTIEGAKKALEAVKEKYNQDKHDAFRIGKTAIRCREVTEWEVIEYNH